ncbi:hypothetical protein FEM03_01295 [Phragmitibacter flavus]|uniref:Uncharacterized protein n=1 Tax=Phragmitibacter flavus TaxID=2576071 RepID=A0A5R8KKG7_9BACT|nr:hypothetical protein [Phragmitibacter flavus]TLD72737.1 hypothetical protein FEM03_01295 [Phragmitibacter flavus]
MPHPQLFFASLTISVLVAGATMSVDVRVNAQTVDPPASSASASTPAPASNPSPSPAPTPGVEAAKDGSVWGALVYASAANPDKPAPVDPPEFPGLSKRLAKAFPFERFEVIGQHTQVVFREYESWVVPSREVFLKLDSKGATENNGLNLHIQFWRGQQVLVKTDTVLRPDSPLFISGPKWGVGQLIFVLELQKDDAKKGK